MKRNFELINDFDMQDLSDLRLLSENGPYWVSTGGNGVLLDMNRPT